MTADDLFDFPFLLVRKEFTHVRSHDEMSECEREYIVYVQSSCLSTPSSTHWNIKKMREMTLFRCFVVKNTSASIRFVSISGTRQQQQNQSSNQDVHFM